MSRTAGPSWLIFTKRSNCTASPFFGSLSETLSVLHPMSHIPFVSSSFCPLLRVWSWVSPWSLSQTLLHRGCLSDRQHSRVPRSFGVWLCTSLGFLFNQKLPVCFIPPASLDVQLQHCLSYPAVLTALRRTQDAEQLEAISPSSDSGALPFSPLLWPLSLHTLYYSYLRMCFISSAEMEIPWEQNYVFCNFISLIIYPKTTTCRTMFSVKMFSILTRIYRIPLYRALC